MTPTPIKRTTIPMSAQDETALAMRPIPKPRMSLSFSTTRITSLPIDSSLQSEQTVTDQWQIAPNVPQIVDIISDVPETDDSFPVPSAIHRDSLAPLVLTPSPPFRCRLRLFKGPSMKSPSHQRFFQHQLYHMPLMSRIPECDSHSIGQHKSS